MFGRDLRNHRTSHIRALPALEAQCEREGLLDLFGSVGPQGRLFVYGHFSEQSVQEPLKVATRGILVNAIAPSIIDTPANRAAMPKADHAAWPKPDQIAATIAFLASSDNQVTTGAIVPVPGPT